MRQLTFLEPKKLEWEVVPEPTVESPREAIVQPLAVATCDLDLAIIHGQAPIPGPFAFGHEFIARVVEVGPEVTSVQAGDTVVVPFQITCGECDTCKRGLTANCTGVEPKRAMYGLGTISGKDWGGAMSDRVRVPHADAMLVPLPAGVDPVAVASMSDNLPDAWRTVGPHLEANPGGSVLVVGAARPASRCTPSASPGPWAPARSRTSTTTPAGWSWRPRSAPRPSRALPRAASAGMPSPSTPAARPPASPAPCAPPSRPGSAPVSASTTRPRRPCPFSTCTPTASPSSPAGWTPGL